MINNFNVMIDYNQIVKAYQNNDFPNAHCLLWSHEDGVELLSGEDNKNLITEKTERRIALNGSTKL